MHKIFCIFHLCRRLLEITLQGQDEPLNNNCLHPNDLILTATSYMICFCLPLEKGWGLVL